MINEIPWIGYSSYFQRHSELILEDLGMPIRDLHNLKLALKFIYEANAPLFIVNFEVNSTGVSLPDDVSSRDTRAVSRYVIKTIRGSAMNSKVPVIVPYIGVLEDGSKKLYQASGGSEFYDALYENSSKDLVTLIKKTLKTQG